jgi:hypothetical protein
VDEFALEDVAMSPGFREQISKLIKSMAKRGEPWLTRFEAAALRDRLNALGFSETFYLSEAVQIMAAWK